MSLPDEKRLIRMMPDTHGVVWSCLVLAALAAWACSDNWVNDSGELKMEGCLGVPSTVVANVTLLTMESPAADTGPLEGHAVWVCDEMILEVGPTTRLLPRAQRLSSQPVLVVEGKDHFLTPGLVDSHVHVQHEEDLWSLLAYGITTAFHLGAPNEVHDDVLRWRDQIVARQRIGPTLYVAGPSLDGPSPAHPGWSRSVATLDDAEVAVRDQAARGFDFIKIYSRLERNVYENIASLAERQGLPTVGHIPRHLEIESVAELRQQMVAHGEELFFTILGGPRNGDPVDGWTAERALIQSTALELAARNIAVTPNLSFIAATRGLLADKDQHLQHPEFPYVHPAVRQYWRLEAAAGREDLGWHVSREERKHDAVRRMTYEMQRAGVLLLAGTDSPLPGLFPGSSLYLELSELVQAGLTPTQSLATATTNPGAFARRYLTRANSAEAFGTVTKGHLADLVLFERNPLDDLSGLGPPLGVMVRGVWLSREEIERRRIAVKAAYGRADSLLAPIVAWASSGYVPSAAELRGTVEAAAGELDWTQELMVNEIVAAALGLVRLQRVADAFRWVESGLEVLPDSADLNFALAEGELLRAEALNGPHREAALRRALEAYRRTASLEPRAGLARRVAERLRSLESVDPP